MEKKSEKTQKKSTTNRKSSKGFQVKKYVVYPAHGVGQITAITQQNILGISLDLFVINFEKERMVLRIPVDKAIETGMRHLADSAMMSGAMKTLEGRARIKRTMWSRRSQEYEAKINSGDLVAIAEVVRDLYRSTTQAEQSYSERQLYELALERMLREISLLHKENIDDSRVKIEEIMENATKKTNLKLDNNIEPLPKIRQETELIGSEF